MFNNIKYVYVDLDGTTTNSTSRFSQRTLEAFRHLKNKGIRIGIITGRSIHTMQYEMDELCPELPSITINGAAIYSKNKTLIDETPLLFESNKVIDLFNKFGFSFMLYTKNGLYSNNDNNYFFRKLFDKINNYPDKYKNFELESIPSETWLKKRRAYKLLAWYDSESEKELLINNLQSINNINFYSSGEGLMDVCHKNVSKGRALKTIVNALQIDLNELIVFGDNENDISMFEVAKHSVAMSNANDNVKSYAKYVTELDCENDGFADYVFKNF
ncbi:HAD family hydrolase [Malacoplasma muris]|uniref:HAD family hydrolase n=1 Tax=Malacoplasma muris TaxID=2119 RepID=UPI00398F44DE